MSASATLVVRCVGRKGGEHAATAATQLIGEYHPKAIVTLGISGRLSDELTLGSVVVADALVGWAASGRIEDGAGESDFSFKLAGDLFRSDKWFSDRIGGLRFESPLMYAQWSKENDARLTSAGLESPGDRRLVRGDIAAGPFVAASKEFKAWILSHKRDYQAVDMESSGVASASWGDAVKRTRLVAVRGISDPADHTKGDVDRNSKQAFRKFAMISATTLLFSSVRHVLAVGWPEP